MTTLNLKAGVDVSNLQPEILVGILVAQSVYSTYGFDCIITSLKDGVHSKQSLHYRDGLCRAVDLRINHLPNELVANLAAEIRLRLTTDYDLVQESDHLHLEYDPKPPKKGTVA